VNVVYIFTRQPHLSSLVLRKKVKLKGGPLKDVGRIIIIQERLSTFSTMKSLNRPPT
jgi:hypothetical protein